MQHPPDFISAEMPGVLASLKTLAALDSGKFGKNLRMACA